MTISPTTQKSQPHLPHLEKIEVHLEPQIGFVKPLSSKGLAKHTQKF